MFSYFFQATNADNHVIVNAYPAQTTPLAGFPDSLIESPTDTPATENYYKNKSNNNDDVDCFPGQGKQPLIP